MDQQLMYIQEKLMEVFPDKLYESLSEIKEQDEQLDRMLSNYTYQTGHTRKQVLSQLGFEKKTYFDIKRLQELLDQYDITLEKMGNFFDRTRELIRQQKIKKALSVYTWPQFDIDKEVAAYLNKHMLEKGELLEISDDSENGLLFINNIKTGHTLSEEEVELVLLTRAGQTQEGKVYFNNIKNTPLYHYAHQAGYYHVRLDYISEVNEFLEFLNKKEISGESLNIEENRSLKSLLNHTLFENTKSFFTHFNIPYHLSYEYSKELSEEHTITSKLEKYADAEGVVIIPYQIDGKSNPDVTGLYRAAKDREISLKELIESYGYIYISNEELQSESIEQNFQEALENRLINEDQIYIHSYDPFYNNIIRRANKENKSIEDYLFDSFGLSRVFVDEPTKDRSLYRWTDDIQDSEVLEEDYIKALIEDAMGSDGILHVNDSSHFYRQLYTYAYQFYKYPRELLSEWGINYVYHWEERPETESDVGQKNSIEVVASDVEVVTDYISPDFEDVMSELLQLDQILKLKKEQALEQIYKLYNYTCQCCDPEADVNQIMTAEGRPYLEIHFIDGDEYNLDCENESSFADYLLINYKKCLVVCPYHHKVLHHHGGGNFKLIKEIENNSFYLENISGKKVNLFKNEHLF